MRLGYAAPCGAAGNAEAELRAGDVVTLPARGGVENCVLRWDAGRVAIRERREMRPVSLVADGFGSELYAVACRAVGLTVEVGYDGELRSFVVRVFGVDEDGDDELVWSRGEDGLRELTSVAGLRQAVERESPGLVDWDAERAVLARLREVEALSARAEREWARR